MTMPTVTQYSHRVRHVVAHLGLIGLNFHNPAFRIVKIVNSFYILSMLQRDSDMHVYIDTA